MATKTTGREIVPAEIIVPAMPIPDAEWVASRLRGNSSRFRTSQGVLMRGAITAQASVADAERLSRSIVRNLECAIGAGDRTSIAKMLRDRPEIILVPNACNKLSRWIASGSLRRTNGRPYGTGTWSPLVVAGLVDHLAEIGAVQNCEQAFAGLGALGLSYDSAKRLYRQAFREPGFRALLLVDEEKARPVGDRDLRWLAGTERLSPGKTIQRSANDPMLGGAVNIKLTVTS